jgi:hypothetical protein
VWTIHWRRTIESRTGGLLRMNKAGLALLLLLIASPVLEVRGQNEGTVQAKKTLFPLRLLPGYKIQSVSGIEGGLGGRIWREGGPDIQFVVLDVYSEDPLRTVKREDILWREEQVLNGNPLACVYTKSKELVMSFPAKASFFRAKVQSPRDLTEVLLMVSTFDVEHGYPVDPAMIVPVPLANK